MSIKNSYFFLFFCFLNVALSHDYEQVYNCYDKNSIQTYELFTNVNQIDLHYIDAVYLVAVGPIATILCFAFLMIFLINKDLLKNQPGDLYFGATFNELILSIHWTISGSKSLHDRLNHNPPPSNYAVFCQTNAFISFFAGTWEMLYNIAFCLYLIQKIRTLLNPVEIPKIYYHFISFVLSFGFTFVLSITDNLGKNLFGTCSVLADSPVPYLGPIVLLIYYLFAFYAIFYFNNYIPEASDPVFSIPRQRFLNYYYKYILVTSIIWIPVVVTNIISAINCRWVQNPLWDIALTVGNINKLNTPIALTIMRMNDPFIKKKLKEMYDKCRKKNNDDMRFSIFMNSELNEPCLNSNGEDNEGNKSNLTLVVDKKFMDKSINRKNSNETPFYLKESEESIEKNELNFDGQSRKTSSNITHDSKRKLDSDHDIFEKEEKDLPDYGLNTLTENAKALYIKAMMLGIIVNFNRINTRKSSKNFSFFNLKDLTEKSQRKKLETNISFSFHNQVIKEELPQMWERFYNDFENLKAKVTYYSPKLFDELLIHDIKFINLNTSLAIDPNLEQIKNSSKADGGRGGQFFFFSYDNQIILKSLSNDDFKCLTKMLKPYYEYMVKNDDSLITKIYGVYEFTFFNKKMKKQSIFTQKVMVMRNLSAYPKTFIERIYDLKGSTFQRESLLKKPLKDKVVLKDLDFLKLEKKLFIQKEKRNLLLETLRKDSFFFKTNGIIDYSLLVIKINCQITEEAAWNIFTPNIDGLWSLESSKENGMKYHIGIIDYLQPYNYKKILEKYTKKLMKANIKLDTSAQDPIIYSNRFCKFVEKILTEETQEKESENEEK